MREILRNFWSEEDGPTAVEYAIMLALIIGIIIASIRLVGTNTNTLYQDTGSRMEQTMNNATP